jgi:hypothetical protein
MTVADDIAAGRLQRASEPRLGSALNEDRVGMSRNAVWVLDGASTPTGMPSCCDKDASWYVDRLDAALTAMLGTDEDGALVDVLAAAIADVQQEHAGSCPDPNSGRGPSSTVAIAHRRGPSLDLLVLGDSTVLLDHGTHVATMCDTRLAGIAPELRREIKTAIAAGHGYQDADHGERRAELVQLERDHRNREGGYWIAANDPTAAAHALTRSHPIGDGPRSVCRVALMTDGAERATSMFALYDSHRHLLDVAEEEGPAACIDRVRALEAGDLSGERHPRTKPSDDASLVVWDL